MTYTVDTYTKLVTSEHRKPKFLALIEANNKFSSHLQNVIGSIPLMFDVDSAVGVQLDIVGLWAGVSRIINSPLSGIYFEWDNVDFVIGWDSGLWKGEFDPSTGITELTDTYYRTLIKAKIAANQWDGSIPIAYDVWGNLFVNNIIIIQDKQNMSMGIIIAGSALDALTRAIITGGYIPLKPEGVRIAFYAVLSVTGPAFAWDVVEDNDGLSGWDVGIWAEILTPT